MTIINLTAHAVVVGRKSYPAADRAKSVRLEEVSTEVGWHDGVALITKTYGMARNLPDPAPDTIYIVPMPVRLAFPHRTDLASPGDTIESRRRRYGVRNLVVNIQIM